MTRRKLHPDELDVDAALVRRLVAGQFPQWRDLPVRSVRSSGSDNMIYRLGTEMSVRLPRRTGRTCESLDKEYEWLPRLAPCLPLAVPLPIAKGAPGEGYPCGWAVYRWLEGEAATRELLDDPRRTAVDLAGFLSALQAIDVAGAPVPGEHNFFRGVPLVTRDASVRSAIGSLRSVLDARAVTAAWESALAAPEWAGPPVWLHGDFADGNLLARGSRLSGVVDFGGLAAGDPACDLIAAWSFLPAEERRVFRAALSVDDAMWARGRGWALSVALIALPYYWTTNPARVAYSRQRIEEVLADHALGL
jgi:aminoglycoside phosphotransferase (APT) family kinase protein